MIKSEKQKVFFRADGNVQIGLGHVIRSMALVESINEVYDCHYITNEPSNWVAGLIDSVCKSRINVHKFEHIEGEAEWLVDEVLDPCDILVVDGYQFTTTYQNIIKRYGCRMVCIDDIHAYHFSADVVINHAPGLSENRYSIGNDTRLCLGLKYAMLRDPFYRMARSKIKFDRITSASHFFVCFGGADTYDLSMKYCRLLLSDKRVSRIDLVVGSAYQYLDRTRRWIDSTDVPVRLHHNIGANELLNIMSGCDAAFVPASTVLYEVVATRLPTISGYYVDNQVHIYNGFLSSGLIVGAGNLLGDKVLTSYLTELISRSSVMVKRQINMLDGHAGVVFLELIKSLEC